MCFVEMAFSSCIGEIDNNTDDDPDEEGSPCFPFQCESQDHTNDRTNDRKDRDKGYFKRCLHIRMFFRSTITAIEITVKAASVPMLTKLASVDKLTNPTIHDATAPVSQVLATGVFDFG